MLAVLFWKSLVSTFSVFSFAPVWCHVHWCQLCFPGVSSSLILSCVFKSSVSYFTLKFACACLVSVLVFMLGYAPARPALFCVHAFSLINCSLFVILSFFSSASAYESASQTHRGRKHGFILLWDAEGVIACWTWWSFSLLQTHILILLWKENLSDWERGLQNSCIKEENWGLPKSPLSFCFVI